MDVYEASLEAATESQCLLVLCGLSPTLLAQTQQTVLPGIEHFRVQTKLGADKDMGVDLDFGSDEDGDMDEGDEAEELETLVRLAEDTDGDSCRTERQKDELLQLMFAAIALDTDEQQQL